jgi:hypothetical protein
VNGVVITEIVFEVNRARRDQAVPKLGLCVAQCLVSCAFLWI